MEKIKVRLLNKVIEIPTKHLEDINDEEANFFKEFIKDKNFKFAWTYAKRLPHEYIIAQDKEIQEKIKKVFEKHGFKIENSPFKREDLVNMKHVEYEGYLYWQMDKVLNRTWIYGYIVDFKHRKFELVPKDIKKDVYDRVIMKNSIAQ
ncbi:MAG: hypothetical protein QW641_03200 [Candidatus Aenigmatarchaeota archaeon]